MISRIVFIICAYSSVFVGTILLGLEPACSSTPTVVGWVEEAVVTDSEGGKSLRLEAKLDTGAKTSSLNTSGSETEYKKNGKNWVRFDLKNEEDEKIRIDARVLRYVIIRRSETQEDRRPVIELPLCVGGVSRTAEFTLADRSEMDYPLLVGRAFLQSDLLVDSGRKNIATKSCE